MKQIRRGVFETNSSSTHSLTMCLKSEYDQWQRGEILFDRWSNKFVPATAQNAEDEDLYTVDRYDDEIDYETFYKEFETPSGDKVVGFGYYGEDR